MGERQVHEIGPAKIVDRSHVDTSLTSFANVHEFVWFMFEICSFVVPGSQLHPEAPAEEKPRAWMLCFRLLLYRHWHSTHFGIANEYVMHCYVLATQSLFSVVCFGF